MPRSIAPVAPVVPLEPSTSRRPAPLSRVLRVATRPVASAWPLPDVDDWGRAERFVDLLAPIAHLRWDVSVGRAERLPAGGVLVVVNSRRLALTTLSTALALTEQLGRPVRFVGRPDVVPFGPFLRRVGGLLALPDEVAGALRAGEVVLLGTRATANPRHAGTIDHELVAPAIREGVPVHVAAALSSPYSRSARVEVSQAITHGRSRRGPLAEVELAEHAQRRLQDLLDEMGSAGASIPGLNWLRGWR